MSQLRPQSSYGGRRKRYNVPPGDDLEVRFSPTSGISTDQDDNHNGTKTSQLLSKAYQQTRDKKQQIAQSSRNADRDNQRNGTYRRKPTVRKDTTKRGHNQNSNNFFLKKATDSQGPIGRNRPIRGFREPCSRTNCQPRPDSDSSEVSSSAINKWSEKVLGGGNESGDTNTMGDTNEKIPRKRSKPLTVDLCAYENSSTEKSCASRSSSLSTTPPSNSLKQFVGQFEGEAYAGDTTNRLGNSSNNAIVLTTSDDHHQSRKRDRSEDRNSESSASRLRTRSQSDNTSSRSGLGLPAPSTIKFGKHNAPGVNKKKLRNATKIHPGFTFRCSLQSSMTSTVSDSKKERDRNEEMIYGSSDKKDYSSAEARSSPNRRSGRKSNSSHDSARQKTTYSQPKARSEFFDSSQEDDPLVNTPEKKKPTPKRMMTRAVKKKKSMEVIEIDDSDDESGNLLANHAVARIAIGKQVYSYECRVLLTETSLFLQYESDPLPRGRTHGSAVKNSNAGKEDAVEIDFDSVKEFKYYVLDEESDDDNKSSFFAFSSEVTNTNGLRDLKDYYKPNGKNLQEKFIVVEFRSDFLDLLRVMKKYQPHFVNDSTRLSANKTEDYCKALIADDKKARRKANLQLQNRKKEKSGFLSGKSDADVLLVYPFGSVSMAHEIDNCAKDLNELSIVLENQPKEIVLDHDDDTEDIQGNLQLQVIDFEKLDDGEFLNDDLIDFWCQWIQRNTECPEIHVFSTHFFSQIEKNGPEAVVSWTKKKGINIFEKKLIFIPINKDLHWTLCVVVNPGAIKQHSNILELFNDKEKPDGDFDELLNREFPCILFFDSLGTHGKAHTSKCVRGWLQSEWNRLNDLDSKMEDYKDLFNQRAMILFTPKVPFQTNGWDCGVFVCRFAWSMFCLRERGFTYGDADYHPRLRKADQNRIFKRMITESEEFRFGMEEITNIRVEMKALIEKLSDLYVPWKKEEDHKRKESKAKARLAKQAASIEAPEDSQKASVIVLPCAEAQQTNSINGILAESLPKPTEKENSDFNILAERDTTEAPDTDHAVETNEKPHGTAESGESLEDGPSSARVSPQLASDAEAGVEEAECGIESMNIDETFYVDYDATPTGRADCI